MDTKEPNELDENDHLKNHIANRRKKLNEQKIKEQLKLYYKERMPNPDPKTRREYERRDTRTTMARHVLIHFG